MNLVLCCCPEPSNELPQRIEAPSMPSLLQGADEPHSSIVKITSIPELEATLGEEHVANIAMEVERRLTRSFSRKPHETPEEQEDMFLRVSRSTTRTLTRQTIQEVGGGDCKDVSPEETPEETEEELPPPSRRSTRKMTQRVSYEATTTQTTSLSQADERRDVYRDTSLRTEHMHIEKVRLQSVISKFAFLAVKGRPCIHIDESAGKRVSAKYKLDKALKKFTISHNGIFAWKAVCAVGAVQDVEIFENSATPFPPQVLSELESQEEKNHLVRVVYKDSVGRLSSFCLLEDSREARDIFVQSLLILRHDA